MRVGNIGVIFVQKILDGLHRHGACHIAAIMLPHAVTNQHQTQVRVDAKRILVLAPHPPHVCQAGNRHAIFKFVHHESLSSSSLLAPWGAAHSLRLGRGLKPVGRTPCIHPGQSLGKSLPPRMAHQITRQLAHDDAAVI